MKTVLKKEPNSAPSGKFPLLASALMVSAVVQLASLHAEARRFDFKSESVATYVGGSFGTSALSNRAYGYSDGSGISTDKWVSASSSGEVGLLFSGQRFNLKLGAQYLLPRGYTDIKGKDVSGAELFELNSSVTALIPMATVELLAYQTPTSRFLIGAGAGVAIVTLENKYKVTAAGTAAYPGVTDHVEGGSARVTALQTTVGYETLFTDTVTAAIETGYRYIPVATFKSTKSVTSFNGATTEGGELTNSDGGQRSANLSGFFLGLSLRFYLAL